MAVVVGVDGSRGRWVAAVLDGVGVDGVGVRWHVLDGADAVLAVAGGAAALGIDVPIGVAATDDRDVDLAARALLGRSGSSVFATPTLRAFTAARAALDAGGGPTTLYECWAVAHAAQQAGHPRGTGFSKQAWGLAAGILDVDRALAAAAVGDRAILERVVEVHPECSFRAMASASASAASAASASAGAGAPWATKKSAAGAARRIRLLSAALPTDVLAALEDPALARVPVDDAVDALAAAWSARRWAGGLARVLGDAAGVRSGWSSSGARGPTGGPLRMPQRIVV